MNTYLKTDLPRPDSRGENYWWWSSALHLQRNGPQKTRWKRNDYDASTISSLSPSSGTTLPVSSVINSSPPLEKGKQKTKHDSQSWEPRTLRKTEKQVNFLIMNCSLLEVSW